MGNGGLMMLIDRNELILKVQRYGIMFGDEDATDEQRERYMIKMISDMPSVDAVEVVRCGKCCHFVPIEEEDEEEGVTILGVQGRCAIDGSYKTEDQYCSSGRRREENAAD
jgi:hypothetical protein